MHRFFFGIGAASALISVAVGALAAHGLKHFLPPHAIQLVRTGAQYGMYHALALLVLGAVHDRLPSSWTVGGWFLLIGLLMFSGSLYALAFTARGFFAWITPFGGTALLIGWLLLVLTALRHRPSEG